jgi:Transposase DDE domain
VKKDKQLLASLLDKFNIDLPKPQQTLVKTAFVIICGIIVKETVNLNKLKNQIGTITDNVKTEPNSHYRRLTRFFDHPFCKNILWKWILKSLVTQVISDLDKRKLSPYLLMDGTCWEFGGKTFHLLTLSIVYQGVSLPFFFVNLSKKGCSNQQERKRVLQMANIIYPLKGMILIADREYVGRDWFIDLVTIFELNFVIRLSESDYKIDFQSQGKSYNQLLKKARNGRFIDEPLLLRKYRFRLIIIKNKNPEKEVDDLLILLTNLSYKKARIVAIYRVRWQIECLFKCLKTNGFNLEDMTLQDFSKVRLLICIVIACYVLCVREGLKQFKKISVRKATGTRYESVFRKGYSYFCQACQKIALLLDWLFRNLGSPIKPKPA